MILIDEVAHEDDAGYFRVGGQGSGLGLGQTTVKVPPPQSAPSPGLRSARGCFPQSGGQRPSAESPGPRGQSPGWAAGARRPDTPSITDTRYN